MNIFLPIIDILVVASLIYTAITLLRRTQSLIIVRGILVLCGIYLLAILLKLELSVRLFQLFFSFFVVILAVTFQREFRRFFEGLSWDSLKKIFFPKSQTEEDRTIRVVTDTMLYFAEKKQGALLVFPGKQPLTTLVEGGISLDGRISGPILQSIFDPSSPGHDGAAVIEAGRIKRFGSHLPLAERVASDYGTRHRAALGLAERSDALVVIISEERGTVSIARDRNIRILEERQELEAVLREFHRYAHGTADTSGLSSLIKTEWRDYSLAAGVSILLWFFFVYRP